MSEAEDTDKGFLRKCGILRLCAALLTAGSLAGCASQARTSSDGLINPREEAKIGAAAHPEIVAQFGGIYRDPQLSSHLKDIVGELAKTTGGSKSDYRLTVLDTPTINAFAAPGGYLYVTRGLLALANDEAEVAGVLAHELGHLDARHGRQAPGRGAAGEPARQPVRQSPSAGPAGAARLAPGRRLFARSGAGGRQARHGQGGGGAIRPEWGGEFPDQSTTPVQARCRNYRH